LEFGLALLLLLLLLMPLVVEVVRMTARQHHSEGLCLIKQLLLLRRPGWQGFSIGCLWELGLLRDRKGCRGLVCLREVFLADLTGMGESL
jgi:hypothetical protein